MKFKNIWKQMKEEASNQNLWDAAKAGLRGKFVVIIPTVRKNKDTK